MTNEGAQEARASRPSAGSSKLKAYIEVLRPINCVFGALTVIIGMFNAIQGSTPMMILAMPNAWVILAGGIVVYFIVAGASNLINDYFDLEIDKINRPNRPIPRGDITKTSAMKYFLVLCVAATLLSIFVAQLTPGPVLIPGCVVFFLVIGYVYAWKGKPSGFPGNLMVGASFSFGIPFGSFYIVDYTLVPEKIWFFFATSAFLLISRELVKGMEDMEGDRKFNIKTIANTRGTSLARAMSFVFSGLAIFTFTAPAFYLIKSIAFTILMLLGDTAVVASVAFLLKDKDSKKSQSKASLMLKGGAFLGLVAYVVAPF